VCRQVRAKDSTPIIMLTAKGHESDRIVGLELGADDYVVKPFSPRELVARVRSVLRRALAGDGARTSPLRAGDVRIDPVTREVTVAGRPVTLTVREFDLLAFLVAHPRQVFSRGQLLRQVWEYSWLGDTSTVTVHVRRLRAKVEDDPSNPRRVQTVYGVGYRFVPVEP
jgi:two-component system response regulator ResD